MPVATRRQTALASTQNTPVRGSATHEATDSGSSHTLVASDESVQHPSSSDDDSSSDSSEDDSDDDDDSSASEGEDEQDDDDTALRLQALLLKAKQSARDKAEQAKSKGKRGGEGDGLAGNEEMVLFGDEDEEESSEEEDDDAEDGATPKASTSRSTSRPAPSLPPSLTRPLQLSLSSVLPSRRRPTASTSTSTSGIALAQDLSGALAASGGENVKIVGPLGSRRLDNGKGKGKDEGDRWGQAPLPKLSKKEIRAKQPHTAGAAWFNMPATPMTPELKRDLDALRLANALDPKKFLRGGAKKEKVGEFFQVGHIIAPSSRATTLSTEQQGRVQKRSFVEDLLADEQAQAYAKKKTKEVLAKSMSGRKRQRAKGGKRGAFAMGAGGNKGGGEGGGKRRKV
ncbi:hypothetical protein JCM8097_004986 [Rhodosporidiobolus ruineniae]